MTREEKCQLAKTRGYSYNLETGQVVNKHGKQIKKNVKGYTTIQMKVQDKTFYLYGHHFAWWYTYNECVFELDHINGIRNDNRIENLRSVTRSQNQWNRLTAKGYSLNRSKNKYEAHIKFNNKRKFLGLFETEEEARNAYLAAKQIYHVI
jgi:HNH endonuclease